MTIEEAEALPVGAVLERSLPVLYISPTDYPPGLKFLYVVARKETEEGETWITLSYNPDAPHRVPFEFEQGPRLTLMALPVALREGCPEWWEQTRGICRSLPLSSSAYSSPRRVQTAFIEIGAITYISLSMRPSRRANLRPSYIASLGVAEPISIICGRTPRIEWSMGSVSSLPF
jgi:hypothetical protein